MINSREILSRHRRMLHLSASILVFAAAPAFAQTAEPPPAQPEPQAEEAAGDIVVTGSRIARSGFAAPTPMTTLGTDEFEAAAPQNLANLVNTLPALKSSLTPASSSNNSNFGTGNYLDLRGLGPTRTLVLVDGKRVVPSSIYGLVNINIIPQALVERAEIVTGGASAAWGSDAVAGVVNFIFNRDLEGFKGSIQGGISDHDDHRNYLGSIAFGTKFADGRGKLLLAAEIADNSGVLRQDSRDWGAQGYRLITNPAANATNGEPLRLIAADVRTANASYGGLITSGPLRGIQFGPGGQPIPFNYGTALTATTMIGGDGVRSNADAVLETPMLRKAAYGRLSFETSDALTLYGEASYARSTSNYPLALPGVSVDTLTIRRDNAFLPESIRAAMVANNLQTFTMGRFSSDYAMVQADIDTKTQRYVIGAEGRLGGTWRWDGYYTRGITDVVIIGDNNRITARHALALDSVINPATGAAICRSTLTDPANGCVPFNPFGPNSASQSALDYMMGTARRAWHLTQDAAALTVQGEPFSTWAGPVSIAVGAEYRRESADVVADAISVASGFGVGAQIPWSGAVKVWEGFAETIVPLAKDASWAKALDLNLAIRQTDYSTSGSVTTWKAGLTYDVNDSIRLRATRSRDIRAPALAELFQGASQAAVTVIDPVTAQTVTTVGPVLGNSALTPEIADTLTAGIVLTPTAIPRLRMSLDFFDIKVKDIITSLNAQSIVDRCYTTQPEVCSQITRVNGQITRIAVAPVNLQSLRTTGLDMELDYRLPMTGLLGDNAGDLSFRALVSYVGKLTLTDGATVTRLAGSVDQPTIQGLGGQPHWRFNLRTTYEQGPVTVSAAARYVGGGMINRAYTAKDINILSINGRVYFDLSMQYEVIRQDKRAIELFAAIDNVMDRDPPIAGGGFNTAATVRSLYDQIGRTYTAGLRFRY
ncbi:TonB-dependent receptor domain-containing protein [Sphingomonas colocasiae]|uniref:TonB-dependent receptor n=1 Tax=Sphingomonas colocasiae TaxID=1848973 RepID=A0ABS7PSW3_9SPHN|nr:TonB-dependent receptor [Sphingomonas colocasiae]MBY8824266.1 TonB-dependent receptor [Sphingomonas colocasiae]